MDCVCIRVHAGMCVVVCVLARVGHVCVEVCLPVVLCLSVSAWERVGQAPACEHCINVAAFICYFTV